MRISVALCGTSPLAGDDHFTFYLGATRTTAACRSRFLKAAAVLACFVVSGRPFHFSGTLRLKKFRL
jgi:hypothetical protein